MISSSNILEKSWLLSNPDRLVGPSLLVLCVLLVFSEFLLHRIFSLCVLLVFSEFLLHRIFWIHFLSDERSLKSKIKFTNKKKITKQSFSSKVWLVCNFFPTLVHIIILF